MALRFDDVDLLRDRTLVERFQEGDVGAFDELYRRYNERLVRFCRRRVGSTDEAEEIAQETFTRAYRHLATFSGERRFYPWLTVIAGRLCIDHHRRAERTRPKAEVDPGSVDGGQEAAVVRAADFDLLTQALDRISDRHREVLSLREGEGWSNRQIAERYGVSVGNVEALVFRARQALKREYLAITDDGRWAAVPALGFLVRRWHTLRFKLEALTTQAAPLTMGAASVIIAAGSVGAIFGGGGPSGTEPTTSPTPRAAVVEVVDETVLPTAAIDATTGGVSPTDVASPAAADAPPPAVVPAPPGHSAPELAVGAAEVVSAEEGQQETNDMPINADAGVVGAGADPDELVEHLHEGVGGWLAGGGR